MNGRNLLDKFQTIFIVTVIAVLVWLYAEGEAVTERTVPVQVRFEAPPGRQLAIEPRSASVTATLRASAGQMDQVRELVDEPVRIQIHETPDNGSTETVIVFRDRLLETPLGELGVNIVETVPANVTLEVEALTTEMMDVEVRAGDVQFAQPPTPEPVKVPVTMPQRLVDEARRMKVVAPLDEFDLAQFEVGEQQTLPAVPLRLPEGLDRPWVSLGRDTVAVTFTIRKQTDQTTLTTVPIRISATPLVLQQYLIEIPREHLVLRDVTLSGPADVIERIKSGDIKIRAEVSPTEDELEAGPETLPVSLQLPPGVTVLSPPARVPVEVTRRE